MKITELSCVAKYLPTITETKPPVRFTPLQVILQFHCSSQWTRASVGGQKRMRTQQTAGRHRDFPSSKVLSTSLNQTRQAKHESWKLSGLYIIHFLYMTCVYVQYIATTRWYVHKNPRRSHKITEGFHAEFWKGNLDTDPL